MKKVAPAPKAAAAPAPAKAAPVLKTGPAPKPAPAPAASSSDTAKAAKAKAAAEKKKAADKAKAEAERKRASGGTNWFVYTLGFFAKVAFAAGALAAPFVYLNKEEVLLDEDGAISTEKALGKVSGVVDSLPNKETLLGYGVGGLVALGIVDGLINLPLLNILVGAPVQILGFVTALSLGVRYLVDGKDAKSEAKGFASTLLAALPESLPKPVSEEELEAL